MASCFISCAEASADKISHMTWYSLIYTISFLIVKNDVTVLPTEQNSSLIMTFSDIHPLTWLGLERSAGW